MTRRPVIALAALLAVAACAALVVRPGRAVAQTSRAPKLTLYSSASAEQFVNNEDDRARGKGHNPFGNYKDETTVTKEGGNGPFAGDESMFEFAIYSDANLTKSAGTAVFVCQYNFTKNAFCDVVYRLTGGTLLGAGAFNFNATRFSVAITGGTGKYRGRRGELAVSSSKNHAQRLSFNLG